MITLNPKGSILQTNQVGDIDIGIASAHGSTYGSGVYTATTAAEPVRMAAGTKCVILARALKGRCGTRQDGASTCWSAAPNNPHWLIFASGAQLLPVCDVHYSSSSSSSSSTGQR
jgi:hypothetical protein